MRRRWFFWAPLAILAMLAFIAFGGVIVHWLWNWLLPPLFGWHPITFWEAIGLLALCRILFGGVGMRGPRGPGMRLRMRERMQARMFERWERMTPEERERFRQGMRGRCGMGPSTSEEQAR